MPEDEITLLLQRIKKKKEDLREAEAQGDKATSELLSTRLTLLNAEMSYLESGGSSINAPDSPSKLEFLLKEKKALLEEFKRNINHLPNGDIELSKYREIERILNAQYEYLSAKHKVISENRPVKELGRYMQLAEAEGVQIVASLLEHEVELKRFKPAKKERKKREFTVDFRKIPTIIVVLLLIFSLYTGLFWRKTPYDRDIIRNYVVARNHYIAANDHYVAGDYENSGKEYAVAAAYFNKASKDADLAAKDESGKMQIYFDNKRRFFQEWERISLRMIESSKEFQVGSARLGAAHAEEVVDMAETAGTYNRLAEEAWSLL